MKEKKKSAVETEGVSLPAELGVREESIVATLSLDQVNRFMEDKTHLQILCHQKGSPADFTLEHLLKDAMNIAFAVIQPERGYILLYDASGELIPQLIHRRYPEGEGNGLSISQTVIQKVLKEKAAVLSLDARTDPRFSKSESVQFHGIRSILCVPIIHHNQVLGIFHLDRRLCEKAFVETDLVILTSLANLLAVALAKSSS